jgi:hypothetical protein
MSDKFNLDGFAVSDDNVCTADGGFVGDITGQVTGTSTLYLDDSAVTTISLSDTLAKLNSTSAATDMQLPVGVDTQRISIVSLVVVSSCTVSANFGNNITTATFSAAGEAIDLISDGTEWFVVGNNGVVLS